MPGIGFFLNIICTLLQYVFLFLLYYFLFRISRLMYRDLTGKGFKKTVVKDDAIASLRVIESGGLRFTATEFSFEQGIAVGRSSNNDIVINDTYVSHQHAHIYKENGQYILEDLASSNHTYINGEILQRPALLKSGDLIKIGLVTLEFER